MKGLTGAGAPVGRDQHLPSSGGSHPSSTSPGALQGGTGHKTTALPAAPEKLVHLM